MPNENNNNNYVGKRVPCTDEAIFKYTWPEQQERYACIDHAVQVQALALSVGFSVRMIVLSTPQICSHTRSPKEIDNGNS
jgi:hypothetical protein